MRQRLVWIWWVVAASMPAFVAAQPLNPVRPGDRLSWDQHAATDDLVALRFLIGVNSETRELRGVSCETSSTPGVSTCHADLPTLSPGTYDLWVSAYVMRDAPMHSARSNTIRISVTAPSTTLERTPLSPAAPSETIAIAAAEVASGFLDVTDIAVLEGIGIVVAERSGRFRIVDNQGAALASFTLDDVRAGSAGLMSIALAPQHDEAHLLYAAYVSDSGVRVARMTVGRNHRASQVAVLIEPLASEARIESAVLRLGPDGKLYLALNPVDASLMSDAAAYEGKVLRLNVDGTTPHDAVPHSPIHAVGLAHPSGLAWTRDGSLWIAGATSSRVNRVESRARRQLDRGTTLTSPVSRVVTLPSDAQTDRSSSFLLGDAHDGALWQLTVADDGSVLRLQRWVSDLLSAVRAVATTQDGTIYAATDTALWRIGSIQNLRKPVH